MFALSPSEIKEIDIQLEAKMDWAKTRSAEAEQLALDAARLLSCTEDRLDHIKKQGFFKRCCGRLTGKAGDMERANVNDLIGMQKMGFQYINMLQEQQLMMAHSMLSLKNNLVALAVKEEETRHLIALLAEKTLERFQSLESRVDQLEISTQLQGWILTLEDRDYEELYPQPFVRMLKVVNDFYIYKNDNWNYQDMLFMKKALRLVKIDPKTRITIKEFISCIVDDIENCGFSNFESIVLCNCPKNISNFHNFAIENVSTQSFTTIHGLATQYVDKSDVINMLSEELSISKPDALKRIFNKYIECLNVNLDCPLYLSDIALEILGGLRLSKKLAHESVNSKEKYGNIAISIETNASQMCKTKDADVEHSTRSEGIFENKNELNENQCKEIPPFTESEMENILLRYLPDSVGDKKKCYFKAKGDIPRSKLIVAINRFAKSVKVEDVLAFYDSTIFGSGKDGLIITMDFLYYKSLHPVEINFKEIEKVYNEGRFLERETKFVIKDTNSIKEIFLSGDDSKFVEMIELIIRRIKR